MQARTDAIHPAQSATTARATATTDPVRHDRSAWREPWVWLIVGIPALTVVAGFVTWWIAAQRADSNVAEDYYKRGLAINRSLEREARALESGVTATLELRDGNDLNVALGGAIAPPASITVLLTHPVRAERDVRLLLDRQPDGTYRILSPQVKAGNWGVAIESQDWRLATRRLGLQDGASATIRPDGSVM
jgi:uncharacterized protein